MKNYTSTMKKFVMKNKKALMYDALRNVLIYPHENTILHLASNSFIAIKWTQELKEDVCLKSYGQNPTTGEIVQTTGIERTADRLLGLFNQIERGISYKLSLEKVLPLLKKHKKDSYICFYPNESIEIKSQYRKPMKEDGVVEEQIIEEGVLTGEEKLSDELLFDTALLLPTLETMQTQGEEFEVFINERIKQFLIVSEEIEIIVTGIRKN